MEHALKTVIVTGSNKGIGFGIVKHLAQSKAHNWNIIMACRSRERGEQAIANLHKQFPHAKLHLEELQLSDPNSRVKFIQTIKTKYSHGIDALVNNAAIFPRQIVPSISGYIDHVLGTNFESTVALTEGLLPLLNKYAKIITLTSQLGKLSVVKDQTIADKYRDDSITLAGLRQLLKQFDKESVDGTFKPKYDFPDDYARLVYGMSKLALNVWTMKILVKDPVVVDKGIQTYVMHPGYVATDMNQHRGILTVDQGASTAAFLLDLPFKVDEKYQGQFFQNSQLSNMDPR